MTTIWWRPQRRGSTEQDLDPLEAFVEPPQFKCVLCHFFFFASNQWLWYLWSLGQKRLLWERNRFACVYEIAQAMVAFDRQGLTALPTARCPTRLPHALVWVEGW